MPLPADVRAALARSHFRTLPEDALARLTAAAIREGETVSASDDENPEMFWALRGGGGDFGIVTRFEYRLHPLGCVSSPRRWRRTPLPAST